MWGGTGGPQSSQEVRDLGGLTQPTPTRQGSKVARRGWSSICQSFWPVMSPGEQRNPPPPPHPWPHQQQSRRQRNAGADGGWASTQMIRVKGRKVRATTGSIQKGTCSGLTVCKARIKRGCVSSSRTVTTMIQRRLPSPFSNEQRHEGLG